MKRRRLRWLLAAICTCLLITGSASATEPGGQLVRVGIFDYEAFYGRDAAGNQSGYGYEYLDTLARYGGFRYQYVHGSWAECLEWLANGQIDMLDSAQKTDNRQEKYLFSDYSTGMSYGELFVRADSSDISYNDHAAMNGITVGLLEGNSRNQTFLTYANQHNFVVETRIYKTEASLSSALQEGQVDAIVSSNLRRGKNERSVARFAPTPFYLMFREDAPELKARMDTALEAILVDNPSFNAALTQKYYGETDSTPALTREEQVVIDQSPVLRVAYSENWDPFSARDPVTGAAKGILVDLLDRVGATTGLRFAYIPSRSQDAAAQLIANGQADLLLGFEATTRRQAEYGLTSSDSFMSVPLCLVGRGMEVGEESIFAVPKNNQEMVWMLKEQFPSSAITVLENTTECYQAVLGGMADFTMDSIYAATHTIRSSAGGQNLTIAFVSPVKEYYSVGLRKDLDPAILRALNKGIGAINAAELTAIFTRHTVSINSEVTLASILHTHRFWVISGALLLILLLIGLMVLIHRRRVKKKELLWRETYLDPLTGIGNLNLFEQELRDRLDRNPKTKYVVCKFDIENLKILNEIYGFDAGDQIIQVLAREVTAMAAPGVDACARINGDEFIILKSYTRVENNRILLRDSERHIRELVNEKFNCIVNLKFGMYYLEDNTEEVESILEKANYAHSICKMNPNLKRYRYDEADKQNAIEEKKIEARMEEALEQEQFMLYLQPKYSLADETIAGAEALVRWKSGAKGEIVYPNSFIPLFEKNGFITKLDMYMLERVCRLIHQWMEEGREPTTVSINFSRLHLLNPNFTQEICTMVDRYQVPRKYIEVELTESAMFDNEEAMFAVLQNLHEEGFTLSMDDFGTGYSSLGLLKNLPVDVIKIDRSFFLNSRFKTRARAVIENVMQMAKRLGIHTVAEGVESQEHIDMLREMGCEIVQGYYYSRPVPVSEFRLDGIAQPNRIPYVEPRVDVGELGDLSLGRIELGETTSVFAYRLLQVSMRKTLSDMYGEGEMAFTLRNAGKLAGAMFAREMTDLTLPFEDYLLSVGRLLTDFKIGQMAVERIDLECCDAVITMTDDLDCSGISACEQTLCQYDEGFLAGVMKEYTQKNYSVTETDCWGTGSNFCRFEIKLK